jgi:hypothetical protein
MRIDTQAIRETHGNIPYLNHGGFSLQQVCDSMSEDERALDRYLRQFDNNFQELLSGLNFDNNLSFLKNSFGLRPALEELCKIDLTDPLSTEDIYALFDNISSDRTLSDFTSPLELNYFISFFLFGGRIYDDQTNILDPVCGTTRLLCNVANTINSSGYKTKARYYGVELNHQVYCIAKAIQTICGLNNLSLENVNSLTDEFFEGMKFDYMIADLPSGVKLSEYDIKKMKYQLHYTLDESIKASTEYYFIQMMINRLNANGKAAIVTSDNILTTDKFSDLSIRNWLFDNDYVESIIKLPQFKNYTSNRILWILNKDKDKYKEGIVKLISADKIQVDDSLSLTSIENAMNDWNTKEVGLIDLATYKFKLYNSENFKEDFVEVPCGPDVDYPTEVYRRGYDVTPKGKWEIQYSKTIRNFYIDFDKFFADNEEQNPSAKEQFEIVKDCLSNAQYFIKDIISHKIPDKTFDGFIISSGWAGDVPEDWEPALLKDIISCETSRYFKSQDSDEEGDIALLSYPYLNGDIVEPEMVSWVPGLISCTEDDIIMVRSGANAGEVFKGKKGVLAQNLFRIRKESDIIDKHYLRFVLIAMSRHLGKGGGIKGISKRELLYSVCYLPPMKKQKEIANYLRLICHNIDLLHQNLGIKIPKLEDFKFSLVYELVTGKIEL